MKRPMLPLLANGLSAWHIRWLQEDASCTPIRSAARAWLAAQSPDQNLTSHGQVILGYPPGRGSQEARLAPGYLERREPVFQAMRNTGWLFLIGA